MEAVVRICGKQYHVAPGDRIAVDRLLQIPGDTVQLKEVLFLKEEDGKMKWGKPMVPNAAVIAEVTRHFKGEKILVFKKRPKKTYRKKQGHRQLLSELEIKEISIS